MWDDKPALKAIVLQAISLKIIIEMNNIPLCGYIWHEYKFPLPANSFPIT